MNPVPTPSAWRYEHSEFGHFICYEYQTTRPQNPHHPNYVPMFTVGQLNQYGQASFEEGVVSGSGPCQTCQALARTVMLDQTSHDVSAHRTWVGLTETEANHLWQVTDNDDSWELIKRVEAKLKEKNQ